MAKPIIVSFEGVESSFELTKLDRAKLYGSKRRVALDSEGRVCQKAALTQDGLYLLQSGMTAQGYFDEQGRWLNKSQLVGLDADGNEHVLLPSTLGVAQAATCVSADELLNYAIDAVYTLEPATVDAAIEARLDRGEVLQFGFNYGADFHLETAFLLRNAEGYFCLVGTPSMAVWAEPGQVLVIDDESEASDDLDFEMF